MAYTSASWEEAGAANLGLAAAVTSFDMSKIVLSSPQPSLGEDCVQEMRESGDLEARSGDDGLLQGAGELLPGVHNVLRRAPRH